MLRIIQAGYKILTEKESDNDREIKEKFNRLVNRLMDGCVIPFLGAGVSQNARIPGDENFKPTVTYFQDQLTKKFIKYIFDSGPSRFDKLLIYLENNDLLADLTKLSNHFDPIYEPTKDSDNAIKANGNPESILPLLIEDSKSSIEQLIKKNRLDAISFDRLAEIGEWLWGQKEICDTIQIDKFADLEPLPAHQYLAYLTREGLITEIISTNYDCCIEKAFIGSFSNDAKGREALSTIKDLEDYRADGGKRKTSNPESRPVLHLYKINGCAKSLKNSQEKEEEAKRIILTERQLQNFRDEKWAEELFRDRSRRRNFLFAGFGSEEPQIRHTSLAISREFKNSNKKKNIEDVLTLPNAPFMCTYRKPSFAQLQIMVSFLRSHYSILHYDSKSTEEKIACWKGNTFSGDDAEIFGGEKDKLPADLFFKRLYQAAFKKLVEHYSGPGTVFFEWLKRNTEHPRAWRTMLLQGLFYEDAENIDQDFHCYDFESNGKDFRKKCIGRRTCLLELNGTEEKKGNSISKSMLLWQWLWRMKYPEKDISEMEMWYLPFREDSLFITTTLLFIMCLASSYEKGKKKLHCPCSRVLSSQKGYGLCIEIKDENKTFRDENKQLKLFLLHENAFINLSRDKKEISEKSRLERCIVIPSSGHRDVKERLKIEEPREGKNNSPKRLHIGVRISVSAKDLIRESQAPEDLTAQIKTHFAKIPLNQPNVIMKRNNRLVRVIP